MKGSFADGNWEIVAWKGSFLVSGFRRISRRNHAPLSLGPKGLHEDEEFLYLVNDEPRRQHKRARQVQGDLGFLHSKSTPTLCLRQVGLATTMPVPDFR